MNKLLSFTISLATQIWSLFVLMTVWNWFASDWHVFTMMQLMWLQLFGRLLMLTCTDVMITKNFEELEDKGVRTIPVNVVMSILFLLVLAVAYVVKCI